MRLSLQVQYAICGIFDLAYHADGGPAQVRVIGERQGIPARYLEQIFQRLRRAGLVSSKRGPGGGYRLAQAPGQISLRCIVEAVEGPVVEGAGLPTEEGPVPGRPDFLWARLAGGFAAVLDEVTVESLCRDASRAAVRRAGAESYTYQI